MNGIWLVILPLLGAFLLPIVQHRHARIGGWFVPVILLLNLAVTISLL